MNSTLKSISGGSVYRNAFRIFLILGLVVAVINFFAMPNPNVQYSELWQKLFAAVVFTFIYAFVVSMVLLAMCLLYNLWTKEFELRSFFIQALYPSAILGTGLGLSFSFGTPRVGFVGFIISLLVGVLYSVLITPILSALITGITALFNRLGIRTQGIKIHTEE